MLKNLRLTIINISLGLAVIFALIPQYWPAAEIYSRYMAIACAVSAVFSYLFLDGAKCEADKEKMTQSETTGSEEVNPSNHKRRTDWPGVTALTYVDAFSDEFDRQIIDRLHETHFLIGIVSFEIRDNEAKIQVLSSKKSPPKVPRSSSPVYSGGRELRYRVLH